MRDLYIQILDTIKQAGLRPAEFTCVKTVSRSRKVNGYSQWTGNAVILYPTEAEWLNCIILRASDTRSYKIATAPFDQVGDRAKGAVSLDDSHFSTHYDTNWYDLPTCLETLRAWLVDEAAFFLSVHKGLDVWEFVAGMSLDIAEFQTPASAGPFPDPAKDQIRAAVHQFRDYIVTNHSPSRSQLESIDQQLKYLAESLDRLDQFDWRAVALSTVIGIVTTLSCDTDTGRQLFEFFRQLLGDAVNLIVSGWH